MPTSRQVITETYLSGTDWYRIYSDGWCEQGGYINRTSQSANDVILSKEMADTNYTITATPKGQAAGGNYDLQWITYINVSTTGFTLTNGSMNGNVYATGISWQVCGYIQDCISLKDIIKI